MVLTYLYFPVGMINHIQVWKQLPELVYGDDVGEAEVPGDPLDWPLSADQCVHVVELLEHLERTV